LLNKKFYTKDPILIGRQFTDPLNVVLDKKQVEYLLNNTFEPQVHDLKEESFKILNNHFIHENTIKLIDL